MKMNKKLMALAITGSVLTSMQANAETESVNADVEFVKPIVIVESNAMNFDTVSTGLGTNTIVLATDSSITDTSSSSLGTPAAAALTVDASVANLDLVVNNISATNAAVFTLTAPTCDFDTGTVTGACSTATTIVGTDAAAPLLVGMTLTGVVPAAGTYQETFDVVVTYQ